jgi:UDP-N-acetylglucosamine diphosphorylase/glucosamine-1-phosphate N-acetyltransferase
MAIALFEDPQWRNFTPISLTKPTFDIKVGANNFFEEHRPAPQTLLTREYLARVTAERHADCEVNPASIDRDTVFINGLLHPATVYPYRLQKMTHTFAITCSGSSRLLIARLDSKGIEYLQDCVVSGKTIEMNKLKVEKSTKLEDREIEGILWEPWDIVRLLKNSLATQVSCMKNEGQLDKGVRIVGSNNMVTLGKNATVEVGTVLDVRNGGIYIGPGAYIAASRIVGPAYIAGMSHVKQFTTIESSYIGYNCRIAGEIEHSIISDHTNKAHAGFVGHSYIGEWVNIGAMTSTSDLKMTYGNIKMTAGKFKVDTGHNKMGSFIADMVKTSIGTLIYSGRRIGVSSHLHGLVANDVPSFTIYGASIGARNVVLELDSIIETQRKMMGRRNRVMSKAYEEMIKDVFEITAVDRKRHGVSKGKFAL